SHAAQALWQCLFAPGRHLLLTRPSSTPPESSESEKPHQPLRRVRSFVRREGRLTLAQAHALQELWPRYGLELAPEPLDLDAVFDRQAPRVLEIGFGDGEGLLETASAH